MFLDSLCAPSHPLSPKAIRSETPSLVDSSGSDQSEGNTGNYSGAATASLTNSNISLPRAGETSPSALSGRRKLSTAIATNVNVNHPAIAGRPTVILPTTAEFGTPPKRPQSSNLSQNMANLPRPPRSAPPKSLRQVGRPSSIKERSTSTTGCKSVAPLPHKLEGGSENSEHDGKHDLLSGPPRTGRFKIHRAYSDGVQTASCPSTRFRTEPHPLRLEAWSEPAAEAFQVRGPTYMKDGKKVASEPAAFSLLTVDLVNCTNAIYSGICAHPEERVQKALARERQTGVQQLPDFIFCVNLCVPGAQIYHQVAYFGVDNFEEIKQQATPFGRLMYKFIFGDDDDFRNKTFKLIPRIVEGNIMVRKAVGSKPSILGKKIKQKYIRGDRYFEVIIDIASDPMAQRIVKLCLGYTKQLVVDMLYVLEGTHDEVTLPERVFGGVRMKNIDFKDLDGKRTCSNLE